MKKILQLLMLCIFCWNIAKAQTETEPNNTWDVANTISLGSTGTGTAGLNQEQDWWKVKIPGDGKLTINWTATSTQFIWCEVYDTLGTIQVVAALYTNGSNVHNIDGLALGTYYIKFHAYYLTEAPTYSFIPTFTAAPVANNTEPDSTIAQAKTLALNGSTTGHVGYYFNNHRDSLDIFKISVTQDGKLDYTITSENGQFIYAQLYDGDGSTLLAGNYTNGTVTYSKDGLAPGIYYLKIFGYYNNGFVPYTISNTFTAPPSSNDPVANETPATASTLPLNGSVTGHIGYHYINTRDDVDWWKVVVNADGRLDYTITVDNGQNVYAQLYDGDGITYLVGSYTTTTVSYSKDGLAPGVYYLRVATYYTSEFASYSLSNTLAQPVQSNDIGSNDIYTNALAFPINTTKTGHIGYRYNGNIDAIDWYKIVLTGNGKIDFSITSHNGQNVYAQLYDGDGTTYLAGGYTTVTGNYSKDGLAAGTYYIRILTFYTTEFATYTLSNTFTAVAFPNDTEPNNTSAIANTLAINSSTTGHIGYQYNGLRDDIDFYALTLPVDGKLSFTISNTSGNNANVYAQLYDNNGTTYLIGSYTTTTATYTINNLAAGIYYIRILTFYSTEFSSYSLSNSLEPMNFLAETAGDNSIAARGTLLPANTPTGGHIYFYYNLITDDTDWWKIGYDGTGTMNLGINIEQNHFNTDYPYINYALYLDTLLAPVASGQLHAATNTIPLTGLSIAKYYLKINSAYATFGAYQLTASYTEKCANIVTINSSAQLAGCNGTITYAITGGLPEYTVQLYKNASPFGLAQVVDNTNTITFSNLGVGTYYARSYSFGGSGSCNNISGNTTFAIPATPTISAGGATTFCQGGSVTLTSSAAASYLWSTGATTQSITVNSSGNYTVTAFNAAGCASIVSTATTVTVNLLPAIPTIGASGPTTFCQGGSVTLTSSSATGNLWSNNATIQSITVNATGNYSVTVTNANNCSSTSAPTVVTVNPLPAVPTISAGSPTTFCQGGSVTLTSSSATGNLWSNNATTQSITVNATGNYSVTVTNTNNCSSTSAPTSVTVNPLPTVTLNPFAAVCNTDAAFTLSGGSPSGGSYSGTGVTGGQFNPTTAGVGTFTITYSYTNANNCTATATQSITVNNCGGCMPTISAGGQTSFCQGGSVTLTASAGTNYMWSTGATTQSITVNSSGSYTVTATNANNCTATSAATNVTVNPLPAIPTISAGSPTTFCQGGSVTLTSSSATGNLWSNNATTQLITVNASGNYSVTVTNVNNCSSTSAPTTITVNALPAVPTINASGPTTFCQGGSVTLTSSSATGNLWSNNATTQSITVNASGNYSVTVTNANNCSSTSAPTTVTVNVLPAVPTINASGSTTFCQGGSVTLTSSSATGNLWSNNATTQSITVNASGNYSVTVTNANNCSRTSAPTSVTVNPLPTATLSPFTAVCSTDAAFTITGGSPAGGTYSGTGVSGGQFNPATAGVGTFAITYSYTNANNCTATATQSITVNNCGGCVATITADKPTTFCQGGSVLLTASAGIGYLWSTGATTQSITVNSSGNYSVTVTSANNCSSTSVPMVVTVNPLPATPAISAGGPTTFCQGGSITLTSSAAASYLWSTGATTQAITVNTNGNYSVLVKNTSGCAATSAATVVTVNPLPATATISAGGPTTFCQGGSVTLTSSSATNNLWSTGATTQSITVSASGNYTVKVTNSNNCSSTSAPTTVSANNCGGVYCSANGNSKNKGYIANVFLRTIFNTTGWSAGGYGNYLNQSTSLNKRYNYVISVRPGYNSLIGAAPLYTRVWIDWNQDGDFNDPGELVFAPSGASYFLRLGVIDVPNNALNGSTRMRIAMRADAIPANCGSFAYGEVEDYKVVVGNGNWYRTEQPTEEPAVTLNETFNLYPNPVSEELVIQKQSNDNSKVVTTSTAMQMIDMNGKMVLSSKLTRSTEVIDVRKLPAGIYFVRLRTGNTVTVKKIIIAH